MPTGTGSSFESRGQYGTLPAAMFMFQVLEPYIFTYLALPNFEKSDPVPSSDP
jgi:hypothetical protein